ncbi:MULTISPECIES: metal ABC transporter solute-binding protein, Zn/Mn family [Bacillaceae]|uniref:metal ABC transporter solute-binding protein, Zn/Mn family n=1 Tax=Bacillaceae TaxID=186817 RepID=UPI000BFB43F6|nr:MULTISPECIES: zinc ABC transporter substrate-binding protein [Bacillaceae]PGT88606.1 ABC transporter substrate-binding protein [Bacillus sp. AFS040349]UGB31900.1 zinc ABC transporter substrate-binding protein [Metabacillus sp. B2-18]
MHTKPYLLTSMLTVGLLLTGCGNQENQLTNATESNDDNSNKIEVYTTIFPLEDFTKKIGGDEITVTSVYPPNVDAHIYEPTVKTMKNIADSDLFVYTGAGVEGFVEQAEEALQKEDVLILKAAEGIELLKTTEHSHEDNATHEEEHSHENEAAHEEEHSHEEDAAHDEKHAHEEDAAHDEKHAHEEDAAHDEEHAHEEDATHDEEHHHHGDQDPHVWLDPMRSIKLAENIKNALIEIKPESKETFEENFTKLKADLTALDQTFHETLENSKTKYILVSHAAYGYWQDRYGLEQIAIAGLSPSQEPSQQQLTEIITESEEHGLKYVLFEQNVQSNVAKVIQDEIGAKSLTLHNLESVTEENIINKEDYFSIMEKNVEILETVLN